MSKSLGLRDILKEMHAVRAATSRGYAAQLLEMARLRMSRGKLGPSRYLEYNLFRTDIPWEEKRRFLGPWADDATFSLDDVRWRALGFDKLLFDAFARGLGLPVPTIHVVLHPTRWHGDIPRLRSASEFAAWLGDAPYPLFAKPAVGGGGVRTALIKSLSADDLIVLGNGETIPRKDFAAATYPTERNSGAVVVQPSLKPSSEIAEIIGDRLATARLLTLNYGDEIRVHRAILRVPVGKSMVDNFQGGEFGNLYAPIDTETGRLTTGVTGAGIRRTEISTYPETEKRLAGLRLKDWNRSVELVTRAALAMPGLSIIGWDVAYTDDGPMLVEANETPGLGSVQHDMQGVADDAFDQMFVRHPKAFAASRR
ncbi:MAG: sugar-transfer associated ATP-grasp domain-containing protein [Pacificimonas sp.]